MGLFSKAKPTNLLKSIGDNAEMEYYAILRRADNPEPEDQQRMIELLPFMGLSLQHAERDYHTVRSAIALEQRITAAIADSDKIPALRTEQEKLQQAFAEIRKAYEPRIGMLGQEIAMLFASEMTQHSLRAELNNLKSANPRAFGGKVSPQTTLGEPPPEKKPSEALPAHVVAIQHITHMSNGEPCL